MTPRHAQSEAQRTSIERRKVTIARKKDEAQAAASRRVTRSNRTTSEDLVMAPRHAQSEARRIEKRKGTMTRKKVEAQTAASHRDTRNSNHAASENFNLASQPDFKVISSPQHSTVRVRIIDTTSQIGNLPAAAFLTPEFPGLSKLSGPSFSFLIEHPSSRSLLFDLGMRKDWENLPPVTTRRIKSLKCTVSVQKGVREQLEEHGVDVKNIEGIIWSHWHWDHTGDPSSFDKGTALIVGPGFIKNFTPGYPADKNGRILQSDYEGRELREIAFDQGLKIGRFDAIDYFGDGSFYLLDSPGHAIGHMCGLARVSSTPSSFILMGGDICHHPGQFRPSLQCPLPSIISPNPINRSSLTACPGELFEQLLPDKDRTKTFYTAARSETGMTVAHDADAADASVSKLQDTDALDEVLVVIAHDNSLLSVVDFFPKYADKFFENGWAKDSKWLFLKDFADAVKN